MVYFGFNFPLTPIESVSIFIVIFIIYNLYIYIFFHSLLYALDPRVYHSFVEYGQRG